MNLTENDLRLLIRNILCEQEEEAEAEEEVVEPEEEVVEPEEELVEPETGYPSQFQNATAFTKKAEILMNMFQDLGLPVENIISAGSKEIRLGLQKGSNPESLESSVELVYQDIFPGEDISVDVIPPDTPPNQSGKYNAYSISGQPLIVFAFAGLASGGRGKGYEYEEDIEKKFLEEFVEDDVEVYSDNDMSTSDLKVNGVGVELKLPNAQAGEPFLTYSFETEQFTASNPKKVNQDVASVINNTFKKADTKKKLDIVKKAMKLDANELPRVPTEVFKNKVRPALEKLDNQYLASYEITSADLRKYYKAKGADLIQIKGKGLYHLSDADAVTFSAGSSRPRKTLLFDMEEPAKGSVTFRNAKTSYAMRPHLKNNPLKKISPSPISLDNPADRKLFVAWTKKQNLSESAPSRWQLLAGIKE